MSGINSSSNWTIYILKLELGKYYVGKTTNITDRIEDHYSGNGSEWTKKYKLIAIMELHHNCDNYDEDKYTFKMIEKYGIDNVRGGTFTKINLTNDHKKMIMERIYSAQDRCRSCGQLGNFINQCTAIVEAHCNQEYKNQEEVIINQQPEKVDLESRIIQLEKSRIQLEKSRIQLEQRHTQLEKDILKLKKINIEKCGAEISIINGVRSMIDENEIMWFDWQSFRKAVNEHFRLGNQWLQHIQTLNIKKKDVPIYDKQRGKIGGRVGMISEEDIIKIVCSIPNLEIADVEIFLLKLGVYDKIFEY